MKQTQKIFIAVVIISIVSACSRENSRDKNVAAEEKNEQKFDTRAEEKEANFVALLRYRITVCLGCIWGGKGIAQKYCTKISQKLLFWKEKVNRTPNFSPIHLWICIINRVWYGMNSIWALNWSCCPSPLVWCYERSKHSQMWNNRRKRQWQWPCTGTWRWIECFGRDLGIEIEVEGMIGPFSA